MFRRLFWVALIAVAASSGVALASDRGQPPSEGQSQHHHRKPRTPPPARSWIPEFDPTAAGTIAMLVAGGAVLVSRRRIG